MSHRNDSGRIIGPHPGGLAKDRSGAARRGLDNPAGAACNKGRVLLVPARAVPAGVGRVLRADGFEVQSASNNRDAAAFAADFDPQVVVLATTAPLELGRALYCMGAKLVLYGNFDAGENLEQRRYYYSFAWLPAWPSREDLLLSMRAWMAEAWTQRGTLLKGSDPWPEALQCHEKALALDPQCCAAWLNKSVCLDQTGRGEEAIECCDAAIAINASELDAWLAKGRLLDKAGRVADAVSCFARSVEISPTMEGLMSQGYALHRLGRYQEAIRCFEGVIQMELPHYTNYGRAIVYADAWNAKGTSYYRMGRYQVSIDCYDRAIAFEPGEWSGPWYNKGNSLRLMGRLDEAIEYYDKAISVWPEDARSWNNKGLCLRKSGRLEEALLCCDRAVAGEPPEPLGWYNKAHVQEDLGRVEAAIESYEIYLAVALPEQSGNIRIAEERINCLESRGLKKDPVN